MLSFEYFSFSYDYCYIVLRNCTFNMTLIKGALDTSIFDVYNVLLSHNKKDSL